jgi:hypothetical protein
MESYSLLEGKKGLIILEEIWKFRPKVSKLEQAKSYFNNKDGTSHIF